jgi:hypothetical protein
MTAPEKCPPGSHPHADRPNWQRAISPDEYLANCREGLEEWSERRFAELLGWSRVHLWRAQMMARIPPELFDRLLASMKASSQSLSNKPLAAIGAALKGGSLDAQAECCPHCGGLLRLRQRIPAHLAKVVADWIADGRP